MEMLVPHALNEKVDEETQYLAMSGKTRNRVRQKYLCN